MKRRLAHALLLAGALLVARDIAADPVGDARRGERQFQRCFACHTVDPNEQARLQGPSLFRVIGRPAGTVAGFEYSEAFKRWAAPGTVWSAALLDGLMAEPEAFIPGIRMTQPGLAEPQDRADIIAYLELAGRRTP